jgi:gluconate 2-dehydrogenase alpha chain
VVQPGGNPFEGVALPRISQSAAEDALCPSLFAKAATEFGLHPVPLAGGQPVAVPMSIRWASPWASAPIAAICERFGCGNYSKASAQTTILPVLMKKPNFEVRTECEVLKVNLHPDGKSAKSVTYIDTSGNEYEQPADMVILALWVDECAHDAAVEDRQALRPEHQSGRGGAQLLLPDRRRRRAMIFDDKRFNPFMGAGALSTAAHDFNSDMDHSKLDFVGGCSIGSGESNGRPIQGRPTPPGTPRWGAQWKEATAKAYLWPCDEHRRFGFELCPAGQLSRSRSHLYRPAFRPSPAAHDLRFPRQ